MVISRPLALRCSAALFLLSALAGCPDDRKIIDTCAGGTDCSTGFCYTGECLDPNGDLDGDGVSNALEVTFASGLRNPDSDGDGIDDGIEFGAGTEPLDTDGDLVWDMLEHNWKDVDCDGINDHLDGAESPDACDDGNPCTVDVCDSATGLCSQTLTPNQSPELCNGVDDDCDGDTDEDFQLGVACDIADAPCVNGVTECDDAGAAVCGAGTFKPDGEVCAQAACNGSVLTPQRTCDGAGACVAVNDLDCDDDDPCTVDICDLGTGLCTHMLMPNQSPELCNGVDDDCDGETDEDFQVGVVCDVAGAPCVYGVTECDDAGAAVCGAGTPKPEGEVCAEAACNGLVLTPQQTCDGAGTCTAVSTVDCDDQDLCTVDTCDASGIGECVYEGETPCDPLAPPTTSPLDGRLGVGLEASIVIQFSKAIDPTSVDVQPTAGVCTGALQVSSDDFSSCIGLTLVQLNATDFSLTPVTSLAPLTRYRVHASTSILPADGGLGLDIDYVHVDGFRTGVTTGPAKVAWVTTTYYPATGSFAAFDQRCMDDLELPVGVENAKAFVAGLGRYPCENAMCSGGANAVDWVLQANTPYVRHDGESLGTTTSDALWAFPIPNAFSGFGTNFWSGLLADWTVDSANLCNDWTSGPGSGRLGWDENLGASTLDGGLVSCSETAKLFCIEQ